MAEREQGASSQAQAERGHVIAELVYELGGLAHDHMDTKELDNVLDNMLSKGLPHKPSPDMQRWIHTHRNDVNCKVNQVLGAHMSSRVSSLVAECFGRYHDPKAAECRACLDRIKCAAKTGSHKSDGGNSPSLVNIKQSYAVRNAAPDKISEVLNHKAGQIARTLSQGNKVILSVSGEIMRVETLDTFNKHMSKEDSDMGSKGATKAKSQVVEEPEEEELEATTIESVEDEPEELDEEEEAEEAEEEAEEAEEAAEAGKDPSPKQVKAVKVKVVKPKKEKPVLNQAQQDFQDKLNAATGEEKWKVSEDVAKKLKLVIDPAGEGRVDHMRRVMAIKGHLGTVSAPAKTASKK